MEHGYKKFRKGEVFNSLRDLIPALTGRMFRQQELSTTDKREFWALEDISFEVKRGEAFGVIGPNGAGKSTMLKLLGRVMKPTRGLLQIHGTVSGLIELAAGFHQDLTGRENIYLYGAILGMSKQEIAAKFDAIVDFSGLEEFLDTPVKRYSSGMCARLGFAVASHVNPDVLLVDEVLSVGDYVFQRKCIDRMTQIIHTGATVLFVSHNLKTVGEFCQRCILLDHGRLITIGPTHSVMNEYMTLLREHRAADQSRPAVISKVTVRGAASPCHRFESGQTAWIDVEVAANEPCSKLAVGFYVIDESQSVLFNTSTERLGHGNVSLNAGDVLSCTFEVDLNLGPGIYYPSFDLFRYDNQRLFDGWRAAETIYVSSPRDTTGPVNCFPRVVRQEVRRGDLHGIDSHFPESLRTLDNRASTRTTPTGPTALMSKGKRDA